MSLETVEIFCLKLEDKEKRGWEPQHVATRKMPLPRVGDILQILCEDKDPWGWPGWAALKVWEIRIFVGTEGHNVVHVYAAPDMLELGPEKLRKQYEEKPTKGRRR